MTWPTGPAPEPAPPSRAAAPDPTPEPGPERPEPGPERPEPAAGAAPATGHPTVDASLRELALVAGADPAEQLPAFQAAHRTLRETLASIDEAASPG